MDIYLQRQQKLLRHWQQENVQVLALSSSGPVSRNSDTSYRFRASSSFLYLTGLSEPFMLLLLTKNRRILVIADPSERERVWDDSCQLRHTDSVLKDYEVYRWSHTQDQDRLLKSLPPRQFWALMDQGNLCSKSAPYLESVPVDSQIQQALHEHRLVKDKYELEWMAYAAEASARAFQDLFAQPRALWKNESQIEGFLRYRAASYGLLEPAYTPIVAGGARGCCLHYQANNQSLDHSLSVLLDAGFEYQGYAADITRILFLKQPVGLNKQLYQLLLETQQQVIRSVLPGQSLAGLQTLTSSLLAQGLIDLEIFHGSLEAVLNENLPKCYMHGVGHHLGLDVHDCASYSNLKGVKLQAGMVITIEPGLYFSPELFHDKPYSGLALRIEDDLVVRQDQSALVLTELAAKSLVEVCGDAL